MRNVLLAVGRVLDHLMGAEFKFHVYYESAFLTVVHGVIVVCCVIEVLAY
jgi:hypothetical protein